MRDYQRSLARLAAGIESVRALDKAVPARSDMHPSVSNNSKRRHGMKRKGKGREGKGKKRRSRFSVKPKRKRKLKKIVVSDAVTNPKLGGR